MARLNEPPVAPGPAADTVEAGELESSSGQPMMSSETSALISNPVKRRFLRQNRELAKFVAAVGSFATDR
jgi:hypothetical protein